MILLGVKFLFLVTDSIKSINPMNASFLILTFNAGNVTVSIQDCDPSHRTLSSPHTLIPKCFKIYWFFLIVIHSEKRNSRAVACTLSDENSHDEYGGWLGCLVAKSSLSLFHLHRKIRWVRTSTRIQQGALTQRVVFV